LIRLGITGTPGTGKKSIAPLVASLLGFSLLDLNKFAKENGFVMRHGGNLEVDTRALRRFLLRKLGERVVIFGHLLPDVLMGREVDFIAVLRCNPSVLKARLVKRRYSVKKLPQNVEAELIGVLLDSSFRSFPREIIHEYETTHAKPAEVAELIAKDFQSRPKHSSSWIDWITLYNSADELKSLLSTDKKSDVI
jgi:adenylate kinase